MDENKNLPMHHIDSSIFLELLIEPPKNRISYKKSCKEYLQYKIGKRCYGKISLLGLGEIIKVIGSIESSGWFDKKEEIFSGLITILKGKNIGFWSPQFNCMKKALEVKEIFQFEPGDTLHISCASEDEDCKAFITIDEKLLENPLLEKELGIKIKRPSDV